MQSQCTTVPKQSKTDAEHITESPSTSWKKGNSGDSMEEPAQEHKQKLSACHGGRWSSWHPSNTAKVDTWEEMQ
jgi:hypothetical protein